MRLAMFAPEDVPAVARLGLVNGGSVFDVAALIAHAPEAWPGAVSKPRSVKEALALRRPAMDGLARLDKYIREHRNQPGAKGEAVEFPLHQVRLLPPIPDPGKFMCVGKNYPKHLEELSRNELLKEIPNEPTGFIKLNSTLVGHNAEVERPQGISTLDYEPELVFAIGKAGYRVKRADAMAYVAGITITNDLTAREIQKREVKSGTRFWTAKNMPGFGPVGPYLITLDEIGDPYALSMSCRVNGEVRLRFRTEDQIFKIPEIIEHFSTCMPLEPGDLFATGSPAGVAVGQPNAAELYLKPGDVVEAVIENVAVLGTRIVAPKD